MYSVVEIDRETIKSSIKDEGSFVRATKEVVKKAVESFMRNLSRTLFNDGSGMLGVSAGAGVEVDEDPEVAGNDATEVTISDASFKEANFEERDLVNLDSGTDAIEILKVDPEAKKITLKGTSLGVIQGTKIYMQGSKGNDPEGLRSLDKLSSGSVDFLGNDISHIPSAKQNSNYGISVGRRWSAVQEDAAGAAISTDMLNKVMLKIKKNCGKTPNLIVCSFKQYEKILNLLEDQKRYTVATRAGLKSKSGADISFSGVEFMSVDGPVGIFPERFVEDDRIYLLNDSHIHIKHRPDFGWFDDDGTVFLRKANADAYEARYGGYLQTYINPCFHGVIADLSV